MSCHPSFNVLQRIASEVQRESKMGLNFWLKDIIKD